MEDLGVKLMVILAIRAHLIAKVGEVEGLQFFQDFGVCPTIAEEMEEVSVRFRN
jgi:hypothetical protein